MSEQNAKSSSHLHVPSVLPAFYEKHLTVVFLRMSSGRYQTPELPTASLPLLQTVVDCACHIPVTDLALFAQLVFHFPYPIICIPFASSTYFTKSTGTDCLSQTIAAVVFWPGLRQLSALSAPGKELTPRIKCPGSCTISLAQCCPITLSLLPHEGRTALPMTGHKSIVRRECDSCYAKFESLKHLAGVPI